MTDPPVATLAVRAAVSWTAALAIVSIFAKTERIVVAVIGEVPPLLPRELRWAKHSKGATVFHIANLSGHLLCDGGRSMSRGVGEPDSITDVHATCLHAFKNEPLNDR